MSPGSSVKTNTATYSTDLVSTIHNRRKPRQLERIIRTKRRRSPKICHVTTKLKAIRTRYRQAVDSGRKSGHGRVVLLFFELCESIWGGSLATLSLSEGIETSDIGPEAPVSEQTGAELSISSEESVEDVSVSADMGN
ncbi:hypothetical protein DPX16_16633 [Anabarilius grahami]|uniref:Uncharacterized protein n=1 Tax=Anabarilius grahami TaxID=495550 RepID=A0A3N0YTJ5_ANAGA|nr:hypothetical protein DPX16_16633 [Anabarilius grahami]